VSVPTITSITPSSGLTIGLTPVKIVGTGFRAASATPPAAVEGTGVWQHTVSVTFNGVEADAVMVGSSTVIWVTVPEYFGSPSSIPDAVDVVVTNLDDDEVAIPGETVTETDGYTYTRQDYTAEGALLWVCDQILTYFRRHLLINTALTTDPEYTDDPASEIIAMGELPGIVLSGPAIADDPFRTNPHETEVEIETGVVTNEKPRRAVVLGFQLHLFARKKSEALNIQEAIEGIVSARGRLRILDQRGGSDKLNLQLKLVEGWTSSDDTTSHIRRASTALEVYGVKLRTAHGNETGPQVSPDQPVAWESDEDPITLEITQGVD
jgi:hypothetical protein